MAFAFVQEPIGDSTTSPVITNWTPIVPYTVYRSDSIASWYYYKLVLEVRIDDGSGELLAKIKQRRNGYSVDVAANEARAVFDLRDIVNSQLEDTIEDAGTSAKSIHTIGENTATLPFSQNNNQVKKIYVKAYEFYSDAADTAPEDQTTGAINDTKYYIAASLDLNTARGTGEFQGTAFATYSLDGPTKLFLSDVQRQGYSFASGNEGRLNYIQEDDYHTVGFLNGQTDFNSLTERIHVLFYDSSGDAIASGGTTYIENINANGGAAPLTSGGQTDTNAERLLYFGCGPANLQAQSRNTDLRPSAYSNWAYYTVQATNASDGTVSDKYYFIKQDASCKGFKVRRLAWRNSKGCWDYFNFKMKSTQTLEVSRNNYETMLGQFNSREYGYDNFGRGKKTRNTTAILKETLQTDWITEADAVLLENLIMSTNVQIIENADTTYTVPVMVSDKSFVKKTVANDKMIKYTIKIEYANPVNTNS